MNRRAFQIGGWAALVAGALTAAAAATVAVLGVLALTGSITYPVNIKLGPISYQSTISMPVALQADVCQEADINAQDAPTDCFRFFVHPADGQWEDSSDRRQDAGVAPTSATLTGDVQLTATGGWSPLVAALVIRSVIGFAIVSGVLLLLWRLLVAAAQGDVFGSRAVRCLRGIGWLIVAGSLAMPALDHFANAGQLGYSIEAFGMGPNLAPLGSAGYPGGVNLAHLAIGGLILLLAEVFRHGARLEAEYRLTV